MGYGKRSDFTKVPQQNYDPGFTANLNNAVSIQQQMTRNMQSNKALHTFGSAYEEYDKSVASHGLQHWTGRGPACNLGNDGSDIEQIKKKGHAFSQAKDDRGLLMIGSVKKQKTSRQPGPADYVTMDPKSIQGQQMSEMSRRSPVKGDTNMSRASRDISFSKYASGNSKIYLNGLM